MAHELSQVATGSGYAIVCIGDAWHGLQNAFTGDPGKDLAQAGLNFEAVKLPIFAQLPDSAGDRAVPASAYQRVDGRWSIARDDTFASLGIGADGYHVHQPRDLYAMVEKYFSAALGWRLSSLGSIKGGKEIWFAARYETDFTVGGAAHKRYALLSTSFDTTQATRVQGTTVNVVCNNTMRAAWADTSAIVKRNHNAKFDATEIAAELATIAASTERYKVIGDALATVAVTEEFNKQLFKTLLGIPLEAKKEDIATRTLNNYAQLWTDYRKSADERGQSNDAFTALNAVTRYVDHSKTVQGGDRVSSATFGAGDRFKGRALGLLMPLIQDKVAA